MVDGGSVQRSLFPHLDECLEVTLTDQEKHLVSILEIVQVEMVKGHSKVSLHLMLGVVVLFADQLIRLLE